MPDDREREEKETYHKVDRRIGHEAPAAEPAAPAAEPAAPAAEPAGEETPEPPAPPAEAPAAEAATAEDVAAEAPAAELFEDLSEELPEELSEELPEDAIKIDVYGLLRMSLGMFVEQAWVQMGLQLAPGAKELTTDLKQARLAIDTVNFMKEALGGNLTAVEKRDLEQMLTTLRTNFIQRS